MQATEALKLVLGVGEPLIGRYLVYYALRGHSHLIAMERNPACPLCGAHPTILGLPGWNGGRDKGKPCGT
jgi:sulfur-carrier protein adenylyltransferase/sulfurtransferase